MIRALGIPVTVCHLNEGHAAFCALERVAETVKDKRFEFTEAARRVAATTVFTTHTPVPAGNETFAPKLFQRYMSGYARRLGLGGAELLVLGRIDPADATEDFGMTPLALRLAARANGVSELHAQVSRKMWRALWPKRAVVKTVVAATRRAVGG